MFHSATLKLTGWYLLILMVISILFSVVVFNLSSHEIDIRLQRFQINLLHDPTLNNDESSNTMRNGETQTAENNILIGLFYANLVILIGGGFGSYALARRTLRPIEEAHDAQSRFTSDASHELRTPLAAMKAELEVVIRDPKASKDDLREILVSNLEEVEKLSRLSEMLLNLSRLEHDKLEQGPVNLYKLTADAIARFNVSSKRISIVAHTHNIIVVGNDIAIFELISILIDNALKYSPSSSLVTVHLLTTGRQGSFEITNTGPGIKEDLLPHIFDRFYRADSSRSGKKGYGLGLALAKRIVEIHKGELTATSAQNHSTTFRFALTIFKSTQTNNQR